MKQIGYLVVAITFILAPAHAGDIYRHVDKDGNVVYSDTPTEGSSKVEVDPINIDSSPKAKPRDHLPSESQDGGLNDNVYSALVITAPEDNTTLRNTGEVRIAASLKPGLRPTHRIRFLDNGSVIAPATRNMSLLVTELERGTHQITAEVIDANSKVIISSAPVAVHVHKASILQPRPATAPPRGAPAS